MHWDDKSVASAVAALVRGLPERLALPRGGRALRAAALMCRYGAHDACWFLAGPGGWTLADSAPAAC